MVDPSEADDICAGLAKVHHDALRSGMALGALDSMGRSVLERSYRELVAGLDERERLLLVGEEQGEVVGMAQVVFSGATNADHRAEVQRVGVAANARGRGVGHQVMSAAEAAAREHGVTLLWLTTHSDTDACAFYEAVGYTPMGVMPSYSSRPDGEVVPAAFYYRELT